MTLTYAIGADHDHWSQAWVVSVNARTALWPWEVEVVAQEATGPQGWSTA